MEQTMKRARKNYQVQWKPVTVILTLLIAIYIGIGTSTVSEIRDVLDTGFLDGLTLNDERMYEVNGTEVMTYPKYRYAVAFGEPNQFNYALDGLTYTDTLGIGRKTFVFDYSWYDADEFNSSKMVNYIDDNYWLMVIRMVAYSNQLITACGLFIGLMFINYWLLPVVTHVMASMFGFGMAVRSMLVKEDTSQLRVYEARILRKTVESYEKSQFMYWVTGVIALQVSLYSQRFNVEDSVFVALWVNVILVIFYILNKIVVNHIKLVKQHKDKGEGDIK